MEQAQERDMEQVQEQDRTGTEDQEMEQTKGNIITEEDDKKYIVCLTFL